MARTIHIHAPAKLNLALAVGGPDGDGMHPICSWMVTVNLFDELEVTALEEDRFSRYAVLWHKEAVRTPEIDWPIRTDLAVRAHLALEAWVGRKLPVQLKLEKRIPVGGGLGGGSADAAAMLHAVNELYELGLGIDELASIGATLGSDIPFLVHGGSGLVSGLGEELTLHEASPELDVVIIFPDLACPTGAVYREFDADEPGVLNREAVERLVLGLPAVPEGEALFNDLAGAACRLAPELEGVMGSVSELAEQPARLSGSGSSVFVVCDNDIHAEHLAGAVTDRLHLPAAAVRAVASHARRIPKPV